MTRSRLILASLRYHWRGNLAILLGVFAGSAVLTGALLVGDSLRGSLRERTERQLGSVDSAMLTGRFFRQELASELPGHARPVLVLRGSVTSGDNRARAAIYAGMDISADGPIMSAPLAKALGITDETTTIRVNVTRSSAMPRSSPLSRRGLDETSSDLVITDVRVLAENDPANDFTLNPAPGQPLNLFVPLKPVQDAIEQTGKVNAIFAGDVPTSQFRDALKEHLTLEDWGLRLEIPENGPGYVALESGRLLLEPAVAQAAEQTAQTYGFRIAPTMVYLVNRIVEGTPPLPDPIRNRRNEIPYSVIAALDPTLDAPLGPFLPAGVSTLQDNQIVLADWDESPLKGLKPGTNLTIRFFEPEVETGEPKRRTESFTLAGYVPMEGVAADPAITPEFPGITDKDSIDDWEPPFPYEGRRLISPGRDDDYWNNYRTTPKAYITLKKGQELFGSRFGELTSIRIAPKEGQSPEDAAEAFGTALLEQLAPEDGGFIIDPVRERLLESSQGSNPFGLLFVSFSFFLIASALLLVGLLMGLNLERRASQIGLLEASGFSRAQVRRLLLIEGVTLSMLGALLGLGAAVIYAGLMINLLESLWPGGAVSGLLELHVGWLSLAIGWTATVLMSVVTVWWVVRRLSQTNPSALLAGRTHESDLTPTGRGPLYALALVGFCVIAAMVLFFVAPNVSDAEAQAGAFFGCGAFLLIASLGSLWAWLKKPRRELIRGHGLAAVAALGARNAARNPTRSLLTAGLLATAAFLLVAVESFRRQPEADFAEKTGGSGGFTIVAETELPIYQPLKDDDGEASLDLEEAIAKSYQRPGISAIERTQLTNDALELLKETEIVAFRQRAGDDASCLNLYQATRPRVLGVPPRLIQRGGFRFADTITDADNPWELLQSDPNEDTIPIFVEKNTAIWMLKLGLGDDLELAGEDGQIRKLRIVGLLQDSVFQSELLMSEANFERMFPSQEGASYFLIAPPTDEVESVVTVLETALAGRGFDAEPTRAKVAMYLEVQNTYLSTFQVLGAFGLLLGVLGLGVVLLRGVWERRGELGLLQALGYRTRALNWMILCENALLLILGLGAGVVSALIAVAPHVWDNPTVPWIELSVMLVSVLGVGLIVVLLAVSFSVRTPVLAALRKE